jgi:hypothetical protein
MRPNFNHGKQGDRCVFVLTIIYEKWITKKVNGWLNNTNELITVKNLHTWQRRIFLS